MSSATESRWQIVKQILLSFILASGLWYMVIGSAQVEGQVDLRVDYRSLPEGLVVRDGMVSKISVRLRGPAELLRGLHARDLTYTVDLSGVKRGANVLPINVERWADFKAYEVVDISPSRLVLEVDGLTERVLPLEANVTPLPDDAPLRMSHVLLEPSFVTVKGPESLIKPLEHLTVSFDPNQDPVEGTRAVNLAISAPEQVDISPPVTTMRYTLALKTHDLELQRVVQLDVEDKTMYGVNPRRVSLSVEVPEARVQDAEYQASIRVVVRPPERLAVGQSVDAPVLVVLPAGARLTRVEPSVVTITRKSAPAAAKPDNSAAPVGLDPVAVTPTSSASSRVTGTSGNRLTPSSGTPAQGASQSSATAASPSQGLGQLLNSVGGLMPSASPAPDLPLSPPVSQKTGK